MNFTERKKFGECIRQLRLAKNWSQEELAMRAGLHSTYIGGIERGQRNLGFDNIIKLARALDEHPSALFVDWQK
jgi:transcriptional regulator with XRE-family HTH domain